MRLGFVVGLGLALGRPPLAAALDNGLTVPPMGWSSWYGFTNNIDESMLRGMGDAMASSGLREAGYQHIWIDDGWALPRDNTTGGCGDYGPVAGTKASCKVVVDPVLFPSGMRNLSDHLHGKGLKFGIYTSKGPKTCLGYQPTQPRRPGSCGYEQIDADTYVHDWQVDQVKDDGCGSCPQHEPFAAMSVALNRTGKPIWYAIHSSILGVGNPNGTVANMWRTGGDLSASSFGMWTNRLDLATTGVQRALAGPGSFPNPDFLEVGYSPRQAKGRTQSPLEQRAMFTMWAALPGPLILSADLRPGAACGGIDDKYTMATLTNKEVIAVNQDPRAAPMEPVRRDGAEVWQKPLADGGLALVLFSRNVSTPSTPLPMTLSGTATVTVAAPPKAGDQLSIDASCDLSVDFSSGAIKLRAQPLLCVGSIGTCPCSTPKSPLLGLVKCNPTDSTQHWAWDPATGQILHDSQHDMNSGPICAGQGGNSMLLYPRQGHANEHYMYNNTTGIVSLSTSRCLGVSPAPPAPPPPPPPPPVPRSISVTWKELGLPEGQSMVVRDLWAQSDLGTHTGSFSASVQWHEARIYRLTWSRGAAQ